MPAIVAYTQAELLALFDRIFPTGYWQPILEREGDGLELFQAIAQVLSLTSATVQIFWRGSFITLAPAGVYSTVTVEFYRAAATLGAVTMLAGTVVTTSQGHRDFITQADVVFGALDLGPFEVVCTALYPDDEFNVPGPSTTAAGEVVPGSIDTIKKFLQDPPFGDPTILVRQVNDATGGVLPWLEQLGADRGILREAGELEAIYRWRIRQLPHVVTPAAIKEFIAGLFSQTGFSASSIEQNSMAYQTVYDGPDTSDGEYDSNLFCYDDPRPAIPFRNRWLDGIEARGAFVVIVPLLTSISETGMVLDDTAASSIDLLTLQGQRAMGAFDVPDGLLPPNGVQEGCYDGTDAGIEAFYSGLVMQLDSIKAAGVSVAIELEGN